MFGIPVALEAFKASKEVLVRRPAPPGIRPFLENKRSIQGGHVNARSKQSTLWEIVNEFTNSIVSSNAQGGLLKNCRGEEQNNAIDRRREL